jgi:hypothetical protein
MLCLFCRILDALNQMEDLVWAQGKESSGRPILTCMLTFSWLFVHIYIYIYIYIHTYIHTYIYTHTHTDSAGLNGKKMLPKLRSKRITASSSTLDAPPLAPRQTRISTQRPAGIDTQQHWSECIPEVSPSTLAVASVPSPGPVSSGLHTLPSGTPSRSAVRSRSPGPKSPTYTPAMMRNVSPVRVESSEGADPSNFGGNGTVNGAKGVATATRRRTGSAANSGPGRCAGVPLSNINGNSGLPTSRLRDSAGVHEGDGEGDAPVRGRGTARGPFGETKKVCLCACM